jgi:hypothetical protein
MGLPGFRCASMPLAAVLIFSGLVELEAGFRALEEVFGVAAAVDMDGEWKTRACSVAWVGGPVGGSGSRSDGRGRMELQL